MLRGQYRVEHEMNATQRENVIAQLHFVLEVDEDVAMAESSRQSVAASAARITASLAAEPNGGHFYVRESYDPPRT